MYVMYLMREERDLGLVNVHVVQQQLEVRSFINANIPSSADNLRSLSITVKRINDESRHNAFISEYQALLQRHGV